MLKHFLQSAAWNIKYSLMSYRCIVMTENIAHPPALPFCDLKWGVKSISFQSQELPTSSADVSNMALSADGLFVENCDLLDYYAASVGNSLPTFILKGLDPRRLER
jgi:hypothetical protein